MDNTRSLFIQLLISAKNKAIGIRRSQYTDTSSANYLCVFANTQTYSILSLVIFSLFCIYFENLWIYALFE